MDVDLSSPDAFVDSVPHPTFDRHRADGPVGWLDPTPRHGMRDGRGVWSVTGHAEVSEVLRQAQLFSSWEAGIRMEEHGAESLAIERRMLIMLDPPDHTRLRLTVNKRFLPRMVSRLRHSIEEITAEVLDRVAADGECNFVDDIAVEIPLLVIADLLGVEKADRPRFRRWSDTIISADDPDLATSPADAAMAMGELIDYGRGVLKRKGEQPGDDILSILATAKSDDGVLTGERLLMFWYLLLIAGNETTRNALSNAMVAFAEHPDQWERLRGLAVGADQGDPAIDTAIEELLRYVSPVNYLRRTATEDAELGGVRIAAGDPVVAWLTAANRDPAVFTDPHRLDLGRTTNPHVAFGLGTHFCLGAHLARLEIDVVLRALVERMPDLQAVGPGERVRTNFINGMKSLPVRYTPAAA
ncbi:MAG: cytochrome P450 [Actinomycetota bacterium]